MNEIEQHYRAGQRAAIRGQWRVLCSAPGRIHFDRWYAGYDSVPDELRGTGPETGPIPQELLARLAELNPGVYQA